MSADPEIRQFEALKPRLVSIWEAQRADEAYQHTSVIVPSLSVDQEELAKVTGAAFYEERLMFALIRLRNPNARVIYVTSQPVHPDIVEYYLELLPGIVTSHARRRLQMISVYDATQRPLSEKLLERPRLLERLKAAIGDPQRAYLTAYNCTALERRLAIALGIPLNGVDPALLYHGTKSGSRRIFAEAGIEHPDGYNDLASEHDVVDALLELAGARPDIRRAVVKLNEGFAGEGNGVFTYPDDRRDRRAVTEALRNLKWPSPKVRYESFIDKFVAMGGVVEEMVEAPQIRSPSVQMRIHPNGVGAIVSTHEQVLGGETGQAYIGCRFPARDDYREDLQHDGQKVAEVLSRHGVIGRFGVDFLAYPRQGGDWRRLAIEINLRMCGTTPPFHALEFLTGGSLDTGSGLFRTPRGTTKFYAATDNLKSPRYRGLLPEDLFEIVSRFGLHFDHASDTGVLFYMMGALSQYGKLGMTCIGDSREQADAFFTRTMEVLDEQTGTEPGDRGRVLPLLDRHVTME